MKFSIYAVKFDTPSYSLQSPLKKELGCPSYGTWKYGQMSVAWILPSLFPDQLLYFMWVKTMAWSHIPFGEGNGNPLQYSCLENPMDGGAWEAAIHGVADSRTWLSDFSFTFHFDAWEKETSTHSSVLAWRMPGTGEPGGLPSMWSHGVGHDWNDLAATGIPSPTLALLVVMLSKAHLTSHSRMSGSRWVITASWLS